MEAVPKMPMISLQLKTSPENTEFDVTLRKYIREHYNENPDLYSKEIKELEQLRQNAIKASHDFIGCSTLKKYFAQLHLLQSRFPMSEGGACAVSFTWADVYTSTWGTYNDIKFEMSAIMYNIGALHSMLGSMDNRQSAEGMKVSCTHFQCAAWAFQYLRDEIQTTSTDMAHELTNYYINVMLDGTRGSLPNTDMARDVLNVYVNLMLAQAQECILEKSMQDNRKNTIVAKVATQVAEYYRQAIKHLDPHGKVQLYVGSKQCKEWRKMLEIKIPYYECVSRLYSGNHSEEQQQWGESVAYYEMALEKLNEAIKLAKGKGDDIQEALRFTMDVVGGKYNSAKKDNDFVYHEKVPPFESLPEVKGASLVKGIPFNPTDKDISGEDIFARLIPMETHEASSLYSEEKAKMLRDVIDAIEDKNNALVQFTSSLQIDQLKLDQQPDLLPQSLLETCAAVSVRPNIVSDLVAKMQELSGISLDVEDGLHEVANLIRQEEESEVKFQEEFGKQVPSVIITEIAKECGRLQEAHSKAETSNNELHKAMQVHVENLKMLTRNPEEIKKALPSADLTESDEQAQSELRRLLDKIEEMKTQREQLEKEFREQVQNDDVTKALVTLKDSDNIEEFFRQELAKYDKIKTFIGQNLSAQEKILKAVTDANARYADTRKTLVKASQMREIAIQSLMDSYELYDDLLLKSKEGIDCYDKLKESVTKLVQRISGVCKAQQAERQQIIDKKNSQKAPPQRPTAPKPTIDMPPAEVRPKLKDYLPFMIPGGGGTAVYPNMPSSGSKAPEMPKVPLVPDDLPPDLQNYLQKFQASSHGNDTQLPTTSQTQDTNTAIPARNMQTFTPVPGSLDHPTDPSANVGFGSIGYVNGSQANSLSHQTNMYSAMPVQPAQGICQYSKIGADGTAQDISVAGLMHGTSINTQQQHLSTLGAATQFQPGVSTINSPVTASVPYNATQNSNQGYYPSSQNSGQNYGNQKYNNSQLPYQLNYSQISINTTSVNQAVSSVQAYSTQQYYQYPQGQMQPAMGVTQTLSSTGLPSAQHVATSPIPPASQLYQHSHAPPRSSAHQSYITPTVHGAFHPQSEHYSPAMSSQDLPSSAGIVVSHVSSFPPVTTYVASVTTSAYNPSSSQYWSAPSVISTSSVSNSFPPLPPGSTNIVSLYTNPNVNQTTSYSTGYQSELQSGPFSSNTHFRAPSSVTPGGVQPQNSLQPISSNQQQWSSSQYGPAASNDQNFQATSILPINSNTAVPSYSYNQFLQTSSTVTATSAVSGYSYSQFHQTPLAGSTVSAQQALFSVARTMPGYDDDQLRQASQTNITIAGQSFSSAVTTAMASYYNQFSPLSMPRNSIANHQTVSTTSMVSGYGYNQFAQTSVQGSALVNQQAISTGNSTSVVSGYAYNQLSQRSLPESTMPNRGYTDAGMTQNYVTVHQQQQQWQQQSVPNSYEKDKASGGAPPLISAPQSSLPQPIQPVPIVKTQPVPEGLQPKDNNANTWMLSDSGSLHSVLSSASIAASDLSMKVNLSHTPSLSSLASDLGELNFDADVTPNQQSSNRESPSLPDSKVKSSEDQDEMQSQKEKAMHDRLKRQQSKDPYIDQGTLDRFVAEVERFEKTVEGLCKQSLSGPTPLEREWKELSDFQDKESRKFSISVGRCYAMKNRDPIIMPYDHTRVVLKSQQDDYINASYIDSASQNSPKFIATQSPLPSTFSDFWTMVYEQDITVIAMLCREAEIKNHVYWPVDRGHSLKFGQLSLTLQECKVLQWWTERIINITNTETRQTKCIIHLQFTSWPTASVPSSPAMLLQFIAEIHNYYQQQRSLLKPVLVHCTTGVGRTGAFILIYNIIREVRAGSGIADIPMVVKNLRLNRKFMLEEKEQLKFSYEAVLYYAQDLLMKKGILTNKSTFDTKHHTSMRHPSEDFIAGDVPLSAIQSGRYKIGLTNISTTNDDHDIHETLHDSNDYKPIQTVSEPQLPFVESNVSESDMQVANVSTPETIPCLTVSQTTKPNERHILGEDSPSLALLTNPNTFTLEQPSPGKKRITKADFSKSTHIREREPNPDDPLSTIDPLWSINSKD